MLNAPYEPWPLDERTARVLPLIALTPAARLVDKCVGRACRQRGRDHAAGKRRHHAARPTDAWENRR
jgi:hypothetical protein